jgi:hypothetical protein
MVNLRFAAPEATTCVFGTAEAIVASTDQTVNWADELRNGGGGRELIRATAKF